MLTSQNQKTLDNNLFKALTDQDFDAARAHIHDGAKPARINAKILTEFCYHQYSAESRLETYRFLIEECKLAIDTNPAHLAFLKLVSMKDHDSALIFIENGLTPNDLSRTVPSVEKTLFTDFTIDDNYDSSIENLIFMIDHGADIMADDQQALIHNIIKCRHAHVQLMLQAQGNINTNNGALLENILHKLYQAAQNEKMSESQFSRMLDFMFNKNIDLSAGNARVVRSFYALGDEETRYLKLIKQKLVSKVEQDIAQSPLDLSDTFNKNAHITPAKLLQSTDTGYRVIDHLCVQKKLPEIFDAGKWRKCEDDALHTLMQIMPQYNKKAAPLKMPLKFQKSRRESNGTAQTGLKRRPK